ncbi:MAG: GAF domain-containing sensor histidine kinase [Labilithrix sp.]|nr:GAF domain-containing sensor histidine kinase [Labilithrix sp.]MCW5817213.1 GAF domain-containing sensor histidine kinase [Labilithrix sp.]
MSGDDETARVAALHRLAILDTEPERAYDDAVELAASICGTPIAMMTLLDGQRQWFKAKVGVPFDETPREQSFCTHAILSDDTLVVPDARADERFKDLFVVQYPPSLRFYAGAPIKSPDGFKLGTLCVLDLESRELSKTQQDALEALRRMIERQLELRRVNMELVRLERQKRELTELVVHDLKNPIASILPNARYLARTTGLSENAKTAAQDITSSTEAMLRLVMNLLDISRAEDAALVPRCEPVVLADLLDSVRAGAAARATEQGGTLALDVADDAGTASLDADLVRRVLDNLADNALKYAPGGTVTLGARADAAGVRVTVADDGPGIPAAARAAIFEKYARVDGSPHAERSRGLGLTFCRLAVEAHGGRIWVEERTPRGAVFCMTLPRARGAVQEG